VNSNNTEEIYAYSESGDGSLIPVAGSPFAANGYDLATNSKWLVSTDTVNIYSFSVAEDGAISQASSINAQQYNQYTTGGPVSLFFDRTGATLYDEDIYGNQGANNTYQFFDLNEGTGALSFLGATTSYSAAWITPLSFVGNNEYAYGASPLYGGQYIYGFSRASDGTLTELNINPSYPKASNGAYAPYLAASDTGNNLAITLTPNNDMTQTGPTQIGVYTADSSGNLTTQSTSSNMPTVAVVNVNDLKASPSGKLLAVAGSAGLQVFHFNGANPVTRFSGLLTTDNVNQVAWDNLNHLYAVASAAGKLYVFAVSTTGVRQVPGSPYAITSPANVATFPAN
jgi:WD40 repeat protein